MEDKSSFCVAEGDWSTSSSLVGTTGEYKTSVCAEEMNQRLEKARTKSLSLNTFYNLVVL
jgi:hypothetical protein